MRNHSKRTNKIWKWYLLQQNQSTNNNNIDLPKHVGEKCGKLCISYIKEAQLLQKLDAK